METDELDKVIKPAELGDVHAQYSLGQMYDNAKGVEQNYEEAKKWYVLSAKQGLAEVGVFKLPNYLL